MNQVVNIFKKDIRHHWPEIAISQALLVAFGWFEIRGWGLQEAIATGALAFGFWEFAIRSLSGLIDALVPISWGFLIVRVVQGESLVGDRQFWVTRPYDWKKLLAAKIPFVLAFINLPLFILDLFLLARAGFHPTAYIHGLLWMQVMWILYLFLAVGALATVTARIGHMLLAVLLIVLYFIGMIALSQVIPDADAPVGAGWLPGFLLICTAVAVILLQYSRRRTATSRWLIVGLCALVTVITVATPYRRLIARTYLLSGPDFPAHLALLPVHAEDRGSSPYTNYRGAIPIDLPIGVSGMPQHSLLQFNGIIVTLTNSAGFRWDSGWKSQGQEVFSDQKAVHFNFELKQKVFEQLRSTPVSAHLVLAYTVYHDRNQRQFVVPDGEFALPDVGLCSAEARYSSQIQCRVPLRRPGFLLVTSEMAASTCPVEKGGTLPEPGRLARGSIQGDASSPAEMGISPVHEVSVYLAELDWDKTTNHPVNPGICPGTHLTLSNPEPSGRGRIELQLDNLSLPDYTPRISIRSVVLRR